MRFGTSIDAAYTYPLAQPESLLQTLYAVGERESSITGDTGDTTGVETPNTISGTHDSSDLTVEHLEATTVDPAGGGIVWHVRYALTPCTIGSLITSLQPIIRAKHSVSATGADDLEPTVNADFILSDAAAAADQWASYMQSDITGDPPETPWSVDLRTWKLAAGPDGYGGDNLPWTAARINQNKFGFRFGLEWQTVRDGATQTQDVSEYELGVYGYSPYLKETLLVIDSITITAKRAFGPGNIVVTVGSPGTTYLKLTYKILSTSTWRTIDVPLSSGLPCMSSLGIPDTNVSTTVAGSAAAPGYTIYTTYHYENPARRTF